MMEYFYGVQSEQYASVEIPKELLTGKNFSSLSVSSKILYAVLLNKMGEAKKYNWFDDENRVYIIYPLSKIEKDINFSRHTIIDCMNELEEFGLSSDKYINIGAITGNFDSNSKYYPMLENKLGFNSSILEYIGEFNIIINPTMYKIYKRKYSK